MNASELFGTWSLLRFWFTDEEGCEAEPLGADATGHLILGPDGFFSFNMMRKGRVPFASGDLLGGTDAEIAEAANGYVSFGGTWQFTGTAILFEIAYSFFPNWIGGMQTRLASIEDGELLLQTTGPILMAGKIHRGAARWKRA